MMTSKPTYQEIEGRLKTAEETVEHYAQLAIVNQFAAAVMHEVNGPLEAITNLVYLLEREDPLPARARERLTMLDEYLQLLIQITRNSLSFHRDQMVAKEVDLIGVAESAVTLHLARISRKNVQIKKRYPDRATCHGVSGQLLQVVSNLILNSLEALPETDEASIHVRIRRGQQCVHVTVADNGPGVPAHVETTLFAPHVTSKQNGTGLGLWLTQRILSRHRGTIKVRTSRRPGKSGTVFRVSLPHTLVA